MKSSTSIPLSKTKLFVFFALGSTFVVLGWWLVTLSDVEVMSHKRFDSPLFVHGIGLSSMVFFGVISLWIVRKLFDMAPGLVLNDEGLFENTNMFSMGLIAWADISRIEVREINKRRLIYVVLKDPEKYISACGRVKQAILRATLTFGPSPVTIVPSSLALGADEVVALVSDYLSRYRNA